MADFVAVIRRAVDGLANNTPEMREKVYDKARGAVRRQLESMKPTPSDDLIRRQMDKLEAAIGSVEGEHAEALPAEESLVEDVGSAAEAGQEHSAAAGRVTDEASPSEDPEQENVDPAHAEVSVAHDDAVAEQPGQSLGGDALPSTSDEDWSSRHDGSDIRNHDEADSALVHDEQPSDAEGSDHPAVWHNSEGPGDVQGDEGHAAAASEQLSSTETPGDIHSWGSQEDHESVVSDGGHWSSDAEQSARDIEAAWQDVGDLDEVQGNDQLPYQEPAFEAVKGHFDDQTHASADSVRMPPVTDFPDLPSTTVDEGGGHIAYDQDGAPVEAAASDSDPWNDLEELIGYSKDAPPAADDGEMAIDGDSEMAPVPPKSYRVAPKKRSFAGPILALIGLLIVAGGGYALWLNRDSLTEIIGISDTETPVSVDEPDGNEPATSEDPQPPQSEDTTESEPVDPVVEDDVADSKFTQRLLPNGTEVDAGPGPTGVSGEGQTVSQLNAPPASPAEAASENGESASSTSAEAAELTGEKMFLYEERLGQTAPTAIEGAVSWSLLREPGVNGVQEPVIQGRINVPGKGLTALLTFKRNADASLPASHLVELVFAVPADFEGGAIDSVQRIAMKQTEQDRGDALIAVPAKITDDFHMIALNDFPDARATNIELLRSRNWIDIPLAYRNGRRALLTLQKGETGAQVFNEAIREWAALGDSSGPVSTGQ